MLTQDEAELYDRQIRLWGLNAQSRIRNSRVLMLGFNGIASEVAKILVLAGIDVLTIVDDQPLKESDLTSNLFCRPSSTQHEFRTHEVVEKLKRLNPLVMVKVENISIMSKNVEDFKDYDLVTLHTLLTIPQIASINRTCRNMKIKFYSVFEFGFYGFMFSDLGSEFKFTYEEFNVNDKNGDTADPISIGDENCDQLQEDGPVDESDEDDGRPKKRRRLHSPVSEKHHKTDENDRHDKVGVLHFSTFEEMISFKIDRLDKQSSLVLIYSIATIKFFNEIERLPEDTKEDKSKLDEIMKSMIMDNQVLKRLDESWISHTQGSLSAVCAVLGGVAGQDMIRALSNKDIPISNTFSFDGLTLKGVVEKVGVTDRESSKTKPIIRDVLCID